MRTNGGQGSAEQERLDRQIDHALAGLGRVAPPAELASRLVEGVRAQSGSGTRRTTTFAGWRGWVVAGFTSAVLLGVVGIRMAELRAGHGRQAAQSVGVGEGSRSPAATALGPVSEANAHPGPEVRTGRAVRPVRRAARRGTEPEGTSLAAKAQVALERTALEDSYAPSVMAPPLPLTAQERRVRLMLRRGEKRDLAVLDPVRAVMTAGQDKAEQRAFFNPPRVDQDPFGGLLP